MGFVDAIEDGKIVKVSGEYARREGLVILRRGEFSEDKKYRVDFKEKSKEEERVGFEELRKPLHWKSKQVVSELKENFHWDIVNQRRIRNWTRKKVSQELGISENDLKMIENGVLPRDDFVIVNKIQSYYKINLRKDGVNYEQSMRERIGDKKEDRKEMENKDKRVDDEIEIIE